VHANGDDGFLAGEAVADTARNLAPICEIAAGVAGGRSLVAVIAANTSRVRGMLRA
jgi:hypothetical protein